MRPKLVILTLASGGLLLALLGTHLARGAGSASRSHSLAVLERGRHLVEEVALCIDCHSPRLPDGQFDRTRWLGGAPLDFQPTVPMPWAPVAPPLAGLPGYTEEEAILFLTTGKRRANLPPVLPPMPAFRFTEEEAVAVVAYLKSMPEVPVLTSASKTP